MRTVTACLLLALVAAGCRAATAPTTPAAGAIAVHESPTPFTGITAGDVSGLIPDDWRARPAAAHGGFEQGFVATPAVEGPRGRVAEGMAAVWIDGTRIGVPSDYYYLAAKRAAIDRLTDTTDCDPLEREIVVDHRPSYADGSRDSPGDYVALGEGVCTRSDEATRFKYFVAAPGYGPVHRVGIPASGLYVVVAVVPDTPEAPEMLDTLVYGTQFGSATLSDFISAAKRGRSL